MPPELAFIDPLLKVLEILAIIGGVVAAVTRMAQTSTKVEATLNRQNEILETQSTQIDELKNETKKVGEVLTVLAVQKNQIDRLEEDVRDLKHGRGYVLPAPIGP